MRRLRLILWVLVGLAAIGAFVLATNPPAPEPPASAEMPLRTIGGPFTLTASDGKPFPSSRLNGRPAAIFFGFTHCPDVCPTTLARLARLRNQLGGDERFSIVLISVDPERDTPAEMAQYARLFDTPIVALTGSVADIERVKRQFAVYSAKAPLPGGGYSVDHTASIFLMDRDGRFVATLAPEEQDRVALDKLRRIGA